MATELKNPTTNNLLQGANIRTMKKDLQKLRETEASRESERIIKTKPAEFFKPSLATQDIQPAPEPVPPKINLQVKKESSAVNDILPKEEEKEVSETEAKKYAGEMEKQQIFLLESQKEALREKIRAIKKNDSYLSLEKDRLSKEKADFGQKTAKTAENTFEDKDNWPMEETIAKLDDKIKGIDKSYQIHREQEKDLEDKISEINKSLNQIYQIILQRQKSKKEEVAAKEDTAKTEVKFQEPAALKPQFQPPKPVQAPKKEAVKEFEPEKIEEIMESPKIKTEEK
ncbi:MAG: hypothetical protein AAB877_02905, partial [Patescibacteria group bacterium]